MKRRLAECENRLNGLQTCNELIGRITASHEELYSREARMVPLVEAGCQAERMKDALVALGNACADGDFFIYLADEGSYRPQESKPKPREGKGDMFGGKDGVGEIAGQAEFPVKMTPREVPVTKAYIAMSFSPYQKNQPYAPAKEIAAKLDASGIFKGVDLMAEKDRASRSDIYGPWMQFFRGVRGQYMAYSFLLPFAEEDVRKEYLPAAKPSRRKK